MSLRALPLTHIVNHLIFQNKPTDMQLPVPASARCVSYRREAGSEVRHKTDSIDRDQGNITILYKRHAYSITLLQFTEVHIQVDK